jgi:inorganic pyrophosphatase
VKLLVDYFGREVRLTDERLAHILEHPEMARMEAEIELTMRWPKLVRRSRSDVGVSLFYGFFPKTLVGSKWICVVVKYDQDDAFVITAYLTNQPTAGEDLWPTK